MEYCSSKYYNFKKGFEACSKRDYCRLYKNYTETNIPMYEIPDIYFKNIRLFRSCKKHTIKTALENLPLLIKKDNHEYKLEKIVHEGQFVMMYVDPIDKRRLIGCCGSTEIGCAEYLLSLIIENRYFNPTELFTTK